MIKRTVVVIGIALAGLVAQPVFVTAQTNVNCGDGFEKVGELCIVKNQIGGSGVANTKKLSELIPTVIKIVLGFTGAIAVLFIIIGGFQFLTSGANPDLAKKGKTTLTNAILGLIVVILSYVIVLTITNFLIRPPT